MKRKAEEPEQIEEKRRRLYTLSQVQQQQIRKLEGVVKDAEAQRTAYEDVTLLVKRLWDRLCDDVRFLTKQALADLGTSADCPSPKADVHGMSCADPFLAALVGVDAEAAEEVLKKAESLRAEYSKFESALDERANQTGRYLRQLLELIKRLHDARPARLQNDHAAVPGVKLEPGSAAKPASRPESRSPSGHGALNPGRDAEQADVENTSGTHAGGSAAGRIGSRYGSPTRGEAQVMYARLRTLTDEARHLAGQLEAERLRCTELGNQVADKEAEVEVLQKRVVEVLPTNGSGTARSLSAAFGSGALPPVSKPPSGAPQSAAQAADSAELEGLRQQLQEARDSLTQERAALVEAKHVAQQLESRIRDEAVWVPETATFQQLAAEAETLRQAVAEVERSRTEHYAEVVQHQRQLALTVQEFDSAKRLLHIREEALHQLEQKAAQYLNEAKEAEQALLKERQALGEASTVQELRVHIATSEEERQALRRRLAAAEAAHSTSPAANEGDESHKRAEAAEAEATELRSRVNDAETEASALREAHATALARQNELRTMLDVLTTFTDDPRDLVQCRADEASAREECAQLRQEAEDLRTQLQQAGSSGGGGAALASALTSATQEPRATALHAALWKVRAEQARADAAAAQSRASEAEVALARANSDLAARKKAAGEFLKELENTGQAFEDMQSQNAKLLKQLAERDAALHNVQAHLVAAQRTVQAKDDDIARLQVAVDEKRNILLLLEAHARDIAALNERLKAAEAAQLAADAAATAANTQVEVRTAELARSQAAVAEMKAASEAADIKVLELETKLGTVGAELEHVQAQNKSLNERILKARATGMTTEQSEELNSENLALKRMLRCHVCNERFKGCIISKCYHAFCRECVQQRIENRNRKCPRCGVAFGQADVHEIFF